ncbi:hypothetical protein PIB30_055083 [Stylosanthes scabra]|uniref:Uncharacterized protein n=1 Tax=Stylosanthes scabra TaxID=79078 RepID=A0ABU6RJB4_9FABA|nr:hypothetical protein [Stylosanthes scabra]
MESCSENPSAQEKIPAEEKVSSEENSIVDDLQSLTKAKIGDGKIEEAIQMADCLIEMEPKELDWPLLKAHLRAPEGEHPIVRSLFKEVLKRDPYNMIALHRFFVASFELRADDGGG